MPSSFEQTARVCALVTVFGGVTAAVGAESIEFVGEHLSEIAMDNRYATLPLWNECNRARGRDSCASYSAGYALTHSGTLSIDGPMLAASFIHPVGKRAKLSAFMFFDNLALAGGNERRPLDVLFANPPLALPAGAQFTGLDGSARHFGGGLAFNRTADLHWRPRLEWTAGLLWERVALRDYAFDYHILDGPDTGFRGTLDYSTNYTHVTPSWARGGSALEARGASRRTFSWRFRYRGAGSPAASPARTSISPAIRIPTAAASTSAILRLRWDSTSPIYLGA